MKERVGLANPFNIDRHTLSPHRVFSDAIVTAAVFQPPLLSVLRFGKHLGERFDAVPEDYLRWIVEGQNELRKEVKASARHWLGRQASNGPRLPGL